MLKKYIVVIYLLVLLLPVLGMLIGKTNYESCEKRTLVELPEFQFSRASIKGFESYFDDHFGFREMMTHLSSKFKYIFFKSSCSTDHVVVGKENWLYYTAKNDHIMESFSRKNKMSEEGLAYRTKEWNITKTELAKKGIDFHYAVWPNKSSIYPEYLPNRMLKQRKNNDSRLGGAVSHLKKINSDFQIIDIRKKLIEAKNDQQVYCKFDSHWNEFGAFIAYKNLMTEMELPYYDENDFNIEWKDTQEGDLIDALGICNDPGISESIPVFTLKDEMIKVDSEIFDKKKMRYYSSPNGNVQKRILVFRDSYTSALIPFLKLHFKESYFVWKNYDQAIIEEIQPDIVLDSKVERYFF